jgi:hypothetical protein
MSQAETCKTDFFSRPAQGLITVLTELLWLYEFLTADSDKSQLATEFSSHFISGSNYKTDNLRIT